MTYSIVARCPDTGMLGIAIATCLPAVGRIARFVEPGVGVVASQAQLLPAHGSRVLDGMRGGASPGEALAASLALDEGSAHRQVGVVAADGTSAVHTGSACIREAGHVTGPGFAAQANMMARPGVPEAMAEAFASTAGEELASRLLAALDAAEALGGDVRGRQSAAMHLRRAEETGDLFADVVVDARVDDDPEPLVALRRIVDLQLGWVAGQAVDAAIDSGDLGAADRSHRRARRLAPTDLQIPVWYAVSLAAAGREDAARAVWREVTSAGDPTRWSELVERLVAAGELDPRVGEVLAVPREGQTRS